MQPNEDLTSKFEVLKKLHVKVHVSNRGRLYLATRFDSLPGAAVLKPLELQKCIVPLWKALICQYLHVLVMNEARCYTLSMYSHFHSPF